MNIHTYIQSENREIEPEPAGDMVYRAIHVAVSLLVATTRSRQIPTQVPTLQRLLLTRCWDEPWDSLKDVNHPHLWELVVHGRMKINASNMVWKRCLQVQPAWLMHWPLHVSEIMLSFQTSNSRYHFSWCTLIGVPGRRLIDPCQHPISQWCPLGNSKTYLCTVWYQTTYHHVQFVLFTWSTCPVMTLF